MSAGERVMAAESFPYMQFYVHQYQADTEHLRTAVQHGAYTQLIFNYWQRGEALPDDDRKLAAIAKVTDEEWKNGIRADMIDFFEVRDGRWFHKRIEGDLAAVKTRSNQASEAGKASAAARAATKGNPPPPNPPGRRSKRALNGRSTRAEQPLNHKDLDSDIKNPPLPPSGGSGRASLFDEFVSTYPADSEDRLEPARALFDELPEADQRLAIEGARRYAERIAKGERKVAAARKWLREKGWITAGLANVVSVSQALVFVEKGTPAYEAWKAFLSKRSFFDSEKVIDGRRRIGWYFDDAWPPGHGPPDTGLGHPDLATADEDAA
jgi:uncharacterized protein YdaU (DUF1376 family)